MKTKIKRAVVTALVLGTLSPLPPSSDLSTLSPIMAQSKLFTLEDLNYGGTNYRNMVPQSRYFEWWGDQLVRLDFEDCYLVNKQSGKETQLFSVDDLNAIIGDADEHTKVRSAYTVSFPYAGKPVAQVYAGSKRMLIDWKQKKVVWQAPTIQGATTLEFCKASKASAVLIDDNLYVVDAQGAQQQLSTDGSREIVYGQSVHRDEFGTLRLTGVQPGCWRMLTDEERAAIEAL